MERGATLPRSVCNRVMAKRSEEHTSELQSQFHLVCRLLLEKKKNSGGEQSLTRRPRPHAGVSEDKCAATTLRCDGRGRLDRRTRQRLSLARVFFFLKKRAPPGFTPFPPQPLFRF